LTKLIELSLENNNVTDISPLEGLLNLERLYLNNNRIREIDTLTKLPNLYKVSLKENNLDYQAYQVIKELETAHIDVSHDLVILTTNTSEGGKLEINPDKKVYKKGEDVVLKAIPDPGWEFEYWTGDIGSLGKTADEITIKMDSDKEIGARFIRTIRIETAVQGQGKIELSIESNTIRDGEELEITAVPAENWRFVTWAGDIEGTEPQKNIVVKYDNFDDGILNIKAIFESQEGSLMVNVEGSGYVRCNKESYGI
jgi:hypothetical protein